MKDVIRSNKEGNSVTNAIRFQAKDFEKINTDLDHLTHFNLQVSNHKVGTAYLLLKILKRGYYKSCDDEVNPILDYNFFYVGKCVSVKENLSYEELKKEDFEFSFEHIKTIEELKKEILYRYSYSMPNLSENEIFNLGISMTKLEILGVCKK